MVKLDCLEPLNLTVTRTASILGVTRQALNNLVNEKAGVSAEMAIRLEKVFGSTATTWLQMQVNYDLAKARRREDEIKVEQNAPELVHA
ncbi:MAG: HigA family addiction module antitoxin [Acidobacteriota bacterium]|nr:HigA family addiction module antitoxin [Acidobacteriota bacterium]